MQNPITHFYSVPIGLLGRMMGLVFVVSIADAASTRAYTIDDHIVAPFWWNRIDGPDFWLLPVSGVNTLLISDLNFVFIPVGILLFTILMFTERAAVPILSYIFSIVAFAGYLRYPPHIEPWLFVSLVGCLFTAGALTLEIKNRIKNEK